MSANNAELLAKARAALARRLDNDAFHEHSGDGQSFKGATITELKQLIRELEREVEGNDFSLAFPTRD